MNISYKNRKLLTPVNMDIFKKFISDKTSDNEINNSFKQYKQFLDSEEKNIELLNNAFSEFAYGNHAVPTKLKKYRLSTRKMSLNNPILKMINKDINKKNIISINNSNLEKTIKNKNNNNNNNKYKNLNLKTTDKSNDSNIENKYIINNKFYNTFNNIISHKYPDMNKTKNSLLSYNSQVNNISKKILNKEYMYNKYNNIDIDNKNSNESMDSKKYKTRNNYLNQTSGLFNSFSKSKKILNFLEFYNINRDRIGSKDNKSNTMNMNSISYKTMNNIYRVNPNKNKLFFDIKEIKDFNATFKTKIEKLGKKQKIKAKTFHKRYKKHQTKYFGNDDIKIIKYIREKKPKSFDFLKLSQKRKNLSHKIIGNNYKREKSVSEEIKIRKKKEKDFYEIVDNMLLNNNLFVYGINRIDKRLRLKQEEENYS